MSSNLPLQAKLAYQKYLDAKSLDLRIKCLEEFLREVPKHKATEKIVALNKTKLSKLKTEKEIIELRRKTLTSAREDPFAIKREPHTIQLLMVSDFFESNGVGKTSLFRNLTGASHTKPGIFTSIPQVGIYKWEGVQFQLIDVPSLHDTKDLPKILAIIRNTDIFSIVVNLSKDPIQQLERIQNILLENSIYVNHEAPNIKIEKTGSGGIKLFFQSKKAQESEELHDFIVEMTAAYGLTNAIIKIYDEVDIKSIEMAFNRKSIYKPCFIITTKADLPHTQKIFQEFQKYCHENYPYISDIFPVALKCTKEDHDRNTRQGLDNLGDFILKKLKFIRVFTKSNKGVSNKPLIVGVDSTVGDVAVKVHKDLFNKFKYALLFRRDGEHSTTKIKTGLKFPVQEYDVIEIHAKL
jgi:uncharacterized protein